MKSNKTSDLVSVLGQKRASKRTVRVFPPRVHRLRHSTSVRQDRVAVSTKMLVVATDHDHRPLWWETKNAIGVTDVDRRRQMRQLGCRDVSE